MIQIKLLKDWQSKKAGDIINISKKGGDSAVEAGVGEYLDTQKEIKKGVRNFIAETWFDNAKYNEKEDIIEKGKYISPIPFFMDKKHLAEQFIKIQPIYYDTNRIWWIWNLKEFKWEISDETDILNEISLNSNADTISSKEKNEIIESLKQISRKNKPSEVKNTWIQFKNIIIDYKTGKEFPASPKYFITNPIPYPLHNERFVNTPTIDKIFEEWVGEKYKKTLYEIIAYCLITNYPIHRIFCFIGSGMNGKSKYLELLRKFLGNNNCCSTELDNLMVSKFEVFRLYKKLVCQMGETDFSEIKKTSILKKLSGGDLIGFEKKRCDPFEDLNYAKILISTNNLPSTNDKTVGFYRRWLIIDFPNQFSEKKDILDEIPQEEYECLAVKCIGILKDLMDKKEFHNEGSIEERIKKYEEKSNPFDKFIKEFVIEDVDCFITKNSFKQKFNDWCKENRFREMSDKSIQKKMLETNIAYDDKDYIDWYENGRLDKKQVRVWKGIKFRN